MRSALIILSIILFATLVAAYLPDDPLPPYFAPPWEIFDGDKLYFTIENATPGSDHVVKIEDTERYVYNTLYYTLDGGSWQSFTMDSSKAADDWLPNSLSISLEVPAETEVGYVIAYTCKKFNNEWRCGCRASNDCDNWAIQNIPLVEVAGSPGDCRMPDASCPETRPFCNIATGDCDECMKIDTTLCGEKEVCELGACNPVQCLNNADCVGVDATGLRRSVCNPVDNTCVACNIHVDCLFTDGTPDITGSCDFGTHLCSYLSDNEAYCEDVCMPDDVLNYGGVGKCVGNDRYACLKGDSGCFEHVKVETCGASCAMFGAVAYCSDNPHTCGRPCGAGGGCNPYCGTGYDMFCMSPDPDC